MGMDEKFTTGGSADPSAPPPPPPPQVPAFQGVHSNIPRPPPAFGFPQPMPPPGVSDPADAAQYYDRGYQAVPGYEVAEGRPVNERRLPCCGLGCGWFLFIIGFFLAAVPWYIGVLLLLCGRRTMDQREKPGYIACSVAAAIATVAVIIGATKGTGVW